MRYAQDRGHVAFFYRTRQEYRDHLLAFVSGAVQADQAVLIAVPAGNLAVLAAELDGLAAGVVMTDMSEAGRNPSRILGEVLSRLVDKHRGKPARMISEHM